MGATTFIIGNRQMEALGGLMPCHLLVRAHELRAALCLSPLSGSHCLALSVSLSLVLVVMMKSKELKISRSVLMLIL